MGGNTMKNLKSVTFLLFVFTVLFFVPKVSAADVSPWFVEDMKDNVAILEPGTTTYCDKNFVVENMGDQSAEVQVILGNGSNYSFDKLEPNDMKNYSLSANYPLSGGWEETRGISIDEARIINSTGGDSKIKVHCK
jgi:hypothetical protein